MISACVTHTQSLHRLNARLDLSLLLSKLADEGRRSRSAARDGLSDMTLCVQGDRKRMASHFKTVQWGSCTLNACYFFLPKFCQLGVVQPESRDTFGISNVYLLHQSASKAPGCPRPIPYFLFASRGLPLAHCINIHTKNAPSSALAARPRHVAAPAYAVLASACLPAAAAGGQAGQQPWRHPLSLPFSAQTNAHRGRTG